MKNGMTLIEIMVVVVIIGVIAAGATFSMRRAADYYRLRSGTVSITQSIQYINQFALEKNKPFGLKFENDSIKVFYVVDTDTIHESSEPLPINIKFGYLDNVTAGLKGVTIPPNGVDFPNGVLVAYPHKGASKGTVYFNSPRESRAINVNSMGVPRVFIWGNGVWNEQ
ncbi:prepilin-type N-terminal cleavage/methylation domain-containing protein [bacterium]|nr:prepilin-type N-terminal cleavage/methylation domain-containing protein [bacterium]